MTMRVHHLLLAALVAASGHAVAQLAVDRQEAFVAKSPVPVKRGSLVVLLPPPSAEEQWPLRVGPLATKPSDRRAVAQAVTRGEQLLLPELARQLKAAGCVAVIEPRIVSRFMTLKARYGSAATAARPSLSRPTR